MESQYVGPEHNTCWQSSGLLVKVVFVVDLFVEGDHKIYTVLMMSVFNSEQPVHMVAYPFNKS